MKIELPLENWADLLPFVPRRQLVKLLLQIDNYHFSTIIEYVLNEVGQISLGHLHIVAPRQTFAFMVPIVDVYKKGWPILRTIMPDEPIPKNVKTFDTIRLSYFDARVMNILQKFHAKSLLTNVNLEIPVDLPAETLQQILSRILPLIDNNINSIEICGTSWLSRPTRDNNANELLQTLVTILAQTRILSISPNCQCSSLTFDWYCNWLTTPQKDGWQRMLSIFLYDEYAMNFIEHIKKDFSMTKQPATFFIRMKTDFNCEYVSLENWQTNEKLVIKKLYGAFLISRYPMGANEKWIQANGQEILEFVHVKQERTIQFDYQLTHMIFA